MSDSLTASVLDWWEQAGVDTLVDEAPRDWLARAAPSPGVTPPPVKAAAAPPASPADMPADLPGFRRWLLTEASVPFPARARHDAVGDPASGCMVVIDMPEAGDRGTAQLLTGEAGALFDRMLAAIGLARDSLYLAPFAPARPATGKLTPDECTALERLMRHHIALVAPKRLLLLGEAPVCALAGAPVTQARGRTLSIAAGGRTFPAIASFPPRLVQGSDLRRSAWADLQSFQALA